MGAPETGPRPLIVGFHTELERSQVLRRSKKLADTAMDQVSINPDMTKQQRKEEQDLWQQAEDRNKMLSEEDKEKNLAWSVVGAREEKRLVLQTARQAAGGGRGRGWRGRANTGPVALTVPVQCGRGTRRPGTIRGGRISRQTLSSQSTIGQEEGEESDEEQAEMETGSTDGREAQPGSRKRKGAKSTLEGCPPEKR